MMSSNSTRLNVDYYTNQCQYKLIKDYPVSQNESELYWKSKLSKYGGVMKKSSCGPVKAFNIICQHPKCKGKGWLNRVCTYKWKVTHHDKQHGKETPVSVKVLSYWTHQKTPNGHKLLTEYRLVDKQSLQYIPVTTTK